MLDNWSVPEIFTPVDQQLWEFAMIIGLLAIPSTLIAWHIYSLDTAVMVMLVLGGVSVALNQASVTLRRYKNTSQ